MEYEIVFDICHTFSRENLEHSVAIGSPHYNKGRES